MKRSLKNLQKCKIFEKIKILDFLACTLSSWKKFDGFLKFSCKNSKFNNFRKVKIFEIFPQKNFPRKFAFL